MLPPRPRGYPGPGSSATRLWKCQFAGRSETLAGRMEFVENWPLQLASDDGVGEHSGVGSAKWMAEEALPDDELGSPQCSLRLLRSQLPGRRAKLWGGGLGHWHDRS